MPGSVRGEPVIGHNGGIEGFASQPTFFPAEHVTVVVLANTGAGQSNPRSLAHRLGAIVIGHPCPVLEAVTPTSATLAQTPAVIASMRMRRATSHVDRGALTMQRTHGPKRQVAIASGDRLFRMTEQTISRSSAMHAW